MEFRTFVAYFSRNFFSAVQPHFRFSFGYAEDGINQRKKQSMMQKKPGKHVKPAHTGPSCLDKGLYWEGVAWSD